MRNTHAQTYDIHFVAWAADVVCGWSRGCELEHDIICMWCRCSYICVLTICLFARLLTFVAQFDYSNAAGRTPEREASAPAASVSARIWMSPHHREKYDEAYNLCCTHNTVQ